MLVSNVLLLNNLRKSLDKNELSDYTQLAAELLEKYEAKDIVAAAIRSLTREPNDAPVSISEERPLPARGGSSSAVAAVVIKVTVAVVVHQAVAAVVVTVAEASRRSSGGGRDDAAAVAVTAAEEIAAVVHVAAKQNVNNQYLQKSRERNYAHPGFFVVHNELGNICDKQRKLQLFLT